MSSDESDDEPLSVLAAAKREIPDIFAEEEALLKHKDSIVYPKKKKKKLKKTKESPFQKFPSSFQLSGKLKRPLSPSTLNRPTDVWLYLKDFNLNGPFSCLLCPDMFISRAKMVGHYILNHKKDFCGICRYFVPDREAWWDHIKFHTPWPCSLCVEDFPSEDLLRAHLVTEHKFVHCRLCHFRIPDSEYNKHLFKKHNATNAIGHEDEKLWEIDIEDSRKFLCLICSKSNIISSTFANHYMGFHRFTLKCFTNFISGRDLPFTVAGVDVGTQFAEQLKGTKFGYVDLDQKLPEVKVEALEDGYEVLPEIKAEPLSDTEADKNNENNDDNTDFLSHMQMIKTYKGDEDFDVTKVELILIQKPYHEYIHQTLKHINNNVMPLNSNIDYDSTKAEIVGDIHCDFCKSSHQTIQNFVAHMLKMHSFKYVPLFSCRVCATSFDSLTELDNHVLEEMGEFEDLWICQFCDKEFDNREATRKHLSEHWDVIEPDNCFSPHLGFKCKYCPTLFWNENDRELHQIKTHFSKYKEEFYKCDVCNKFLCDKVWFTHHYLENHHNENRLYLFKCCLCALVLPTVEDMRTHFGEQHPNDRKTFCSLGGCQFKPLIHRKSFLLHLRSQHSTLPRKERAVPCNICGREFPTRRARSAHVAVVHGSGNYKCKLCGDSLNSMDERKLHYLIVHPGRHPFVCNECGKSFQYKSSLYLHKRDHEPNNETYTCDYCQKVFKKKDSFREHIQIHEGPRHACSFCPMRFVQRSNMLRHERRHTGERPYSCQECPRTFADKGACTSHSRTHSRDKSYACMYCGQTFVQKSKLTYHTRKHTGENLEKCSVCSKLFTSACSLREHMKTHQAKKKETMKCPICNRIYHETRYMLRHLRIMHTLPQLPCPVCHKPVPSATGLRHHVLTHSELNIYRCNLCPNSFAVRRTIVKHLRKRHSITGSDSHVKSFYKMLEPRECQLGLDEEVMTKIFGPPKPPAEILPTDFVSCNNTIDVKVEKQSNVESAETGESNDDSDKETGSGSEEETKRKSSTEDFDEDAANELEPTDFVSVKIEPMEEESQ